MAEQHFDVLVVGAGLSGIGAAYRLQTLCPGKRYAILEARRSIGGTWDLFRYPGIRSDSDMFTLGFPFRPWKEAKAIADGPSILQYLRDTAREYGIDRHIRFEHRVVGASWSSRQGRWTLEVEVGSDGQRVRYTCNFLYLCSGYYSYDSGYLPPLPGRELFQGPVVHPQRWPEDLDYRGKRVVVIGSGATAMTLVPAMAETAAHVTLLQRSPTYVVALPARDVVADTLRRLLPEQIAHHAVRWKNVLLGMAFFQFCRRAPALAKRLLRSGVAKQLPEGYPIDEHFKPRYQPWDQRLCVVPEADLFRAIRDGRAAVVTAHIDTFTADGIRLRSGERLAADIVITATGLSLLPCGGIRLEVDGAAVDPADTFAYRGVMLTGVPNFALCVGYTNASWTLRADLSSRYLCRLLNYMDRHGYSQCRPRVPPGMRARPLLDLTAGYIQRSADRFPKQGERAPWNLNQNYLLDLASLRFSRFDDGTMQFARRADGAALAAGTGAA